MNAPVRLEPVDGLITVTAGFTPTTNVHEPESMYCRFYWLADIGPSAYLAFLFLNMWLPANEESASISINYAEFAHTLGTSPGRLTRAISRLAGFHLAYTIPTEPSTLYLKRRAPTLTAGQLARLSKRCPTLAACHEQHCHAA
jgi:hypothetical protein